MAYDTNGQSFDDTLRKKGQLIDKCQPTKGALFYHGNFPTAKERTV